jgi:hypothetical protein
MSAQPDSVTTLETIEHLDFEPETPCEHSAHAGITAHPADLLIRVKCPNCPRATVLGVCFEMWAWAGDSGILCRFCHWRGPRDAYWTVLEVLSS